MHSREHHPKALKEVTMLIRKPITYDEASSRYITPPAEGVVGTHGAHLIAAVNLAMHGKFTGGHAGLAGKFYLNANRDHPGWADTGLVEELEGPNYADADMFDKAIEYAETSHVTGYEKEYSMVDEGIVITFNERVLVPGISLASGQEDEAPELVLPEAPSIESISGIYPVELNAAYMLKQALETMRR